MLPPIAAYLQNKTVLLVGFGREGQSSYRYLRRFFPEKPLAVADRNEIAVDDPHLTVFSGADYLSALSQFDVVLKSPGISFKDVENAGDAEITCQVDLFLRFAPCRKVGVTGSKGKTTTSTLIHLCLQEAGFDSRLIGNIGVPVFEALETVTEDSVAVIEMSSHQLEFTHASPEAAVLTNLFEEHLEHYRGGFAGYARAKSHIGLYQGPDDLLIYNGDQGLALFPGLSDTPAKKQAVYKDDPLPFPLQNEHLLGAHNRQDVLFARAAAAHFGVTDAQIQAAVHKYLGIEHRMEKVGTFQGITFYNDCIATIPHAVLCAVEALGNVDTLLVGGMDRGISYKGFEKALAESGVRNIFGLPDTGHTVVAAVRALAPEKNAVAVADLDEAVRLAYRCTAPGKICLLSPAASSYNVYKNFEEKGRHYKALVRKYGEGGNP